MLIAKLTISYDRGVALNKPADLIASDLKPSDQATGIVAERGSKTYDGKILRGLGSHFRSEADAQLVGERDKEARRIYRAFRERFLSTPIDGLYAVPGKGLAKKFLDGLDVRVDLRVRVSEFEITTNGDMDAAEISEWSKRIKNQLSSISLGRSKEIDENGLDALLTLSSCPLIGRETAKAVKELVEGVRIQKINRVELRRSLETMTVEIDTAQLKPRAMPKLVGAA